MEFLQVSKEAPKTNTDELLKQPDSGRQADRQTVYQSTVCEHKGSVGRNGV